MQRTGHKRRVVVTGCGMVTPLGGSAEETFDRAARGESGIDFIRSFDTTGLPCCIGGEIPDAWLDRGHDAKLGKLEKFAARGVKLMARAAHAAALQARIEEISNRESVGVALGSHGDNPTPEEMRYVLSFYDGNGHWNLERLTRAGGYPYALFFRRKPDAGMAILASAFDCRGVSCSIVSACAAGAQAIGEAYRYIRAGKAEAMIAGGCEAALNFAGFVGFVLIKALVERYASPQQASRPFDRKRCGFVMSEGAGALVLEELEHARARGVPVLGEILGYGDSADAYRITDTHPQGEGAVLAMQGALADAGLDPGAVEYINAHGTSTTQNDAVETLAIKKLFGAHARALAVSSNKSMLGHAIAAAGAIEAGLTLMGIRRSVILPTINHEFSDPKCDLDYVPNVARRVEHRIALSNSFGFGGQNACLCLGGFAE